MGCIENDTERREANIPQLAPIMGVGGIAISDLSRILGIPSSDSRGWKSIHQDIRPASALSNPDAPSCSRRYVAFWPWLC